MVKVTATIYKRTKNWVALLYIVDGINPPRRKSVTTEIFLLQNLKKRHERVLKKSEEDMKKN